VRVAVHRFFKTIQKEVKTLGDCLAQLIFHEMFSKPNYFDGTKVRRISFLRIFFRLFKSNFSSFLMILVIILIIYLLFNFNIRKNKFWLKFPKKKRQMLANIIKPIRFFFIQVRKHIHKLTRSLVGSFVLFLVSVVRSSQISSSENHYWMYSIRTAVTCFTLRLCGK